MAGDRHRPIVYASAMGVTQRLAQVATSVVVLPVVVRALGIHDFGVWAAATSLVWLSGMLDFGIGSSLLTLLPRARADQGRGLVSAALLASGILGLAVGLIGGAIAMAGMPSQPVAPMVVAIACLAVNIPLSLAGNVWFGLQKGHVAAGWELVQTLTAFACLMAGAWLHAGLTTMVAAAYLPMIGAASASLVHLLVTHPELRPRGRRPDGKALRLVLASGAMLFAITLAFTAGYSFDNLLTLQWLGPEASAQAAVALRICTLVAGLLAVATQPLWPAFVAAVSAGDGRWALRTLSGASAVTLALTGGAALFIVLFGNQALRWWLGPALVLPADLMWVTGLWVVVLCTPRVAGLMFNAASMLRFQLAVAALALALVLALKRVLAERFGVAGLIAATPIGWLVVVWPAFLWLSLRIRSGAVPLAAGPGRS